MSNWFATRVGTAAVVLVIAAGCGSSAPAATGTAASDLGAPTASGLSPSQASTPAPAVVATQSPSPIASPVLEAALKELWQVGGPKPPKDGGCAVKLAPNGKLWLSSEYGNSFWIIDPNGKYIESWGTAGAAAGQFNLVGDGGGYGSVAFDPDGTIYVADTGNHRVQKFDKNRHLLKTWGTFGTGDGQFANPVDIASDGHGHVYVVDSDRTDVQEFTPDGTFIRTVATDRFIGEFIGLDPAGHLFVDDGPKILVFDADGNPLPGIDLSMLGWWAGGMQIDPAGHVYVPAVSSYSDPITLGPIYEFDSAGKVLHAWPGHADSLALDPKGGALYTSFYQDPFIRKLELPKS